MSETLNAIASMRDRVVHQREQIRADFPGCTSIIDDFRAAFGPGVKPLYFEEGGKTMGKKQPDFEDDSAKWIWLAMSDAERKQAMRGGR
jgi:hypothetical protein